MPPRYPPQPSFEDLIDQLTNYASDFVQDAISSMADRLKDRVGQLPIPPTPRPKQKRVQGSGASGKRATGRQKPRQAPQQPPRPRAAVRTAYTVLGVTPDADDALIKAAYRVKAAKYHPDTCKDPKAHERMQEVNAAWELLKDPEKRKRYDRGMGL